MKIAIIGAGISGLTAAYLLYKKHDICVYEANNYLGGHTATIDITLEDKEHAVDTGFIVYNDWTYPNFCKLISQLRIDSQPTDMGFSVTTRANPVLDFEYCGSTLSSLFADKKKVANLHFLKMLYDIIRFNKSAKKDLMEDRIPPNQSLKNYLQKQKYGSYFLNYYIYPMASAIWSAPVSGIRDFDALFFVQFFSNHGLLNILNRPQWRIISGGSKEYIPTLVNNFKEKIQLDTPVREVRRTKDNVIVSCNHGDIVYDQVIFACHSDQALDMLSNSSDVEKSVLKAIPYRENSVILHTDEQLLPKRKKAWTSWNYLLDGSENEHPILTYNMNILQGLQSREPICVTVNGDQYINEEKIIRRFSYSHPQFSRNSVIAQKQWNKINGKNRSWYCGAYWANGFHEDGVTSALRVSEKLGGDIL